MSNTKSHYINLEQKLYDKWEQHCHQCGADNPKHLPRTEGGKAFYDTDSVGNTYWIRCGYEGCYWEAHARRPT